MNCNRFRFLIQQNFDAELSPQDEQMLFDHLDSCQSCSRFQHQIDQVIQASLEMPITEEAMPTNLESLARIVMQQLPQQKGSVLGIFGNLFGGGGRKKEAKPAKPAAAAQKSSGGSRFPHVNRQKGQPQEDAEMQSQS